MQQLWRIIRFTKDLWPYYAAISGFTVLLALLTQLTPLFTKAAVDEISKIGAGGEADVTRVAVFAILIFVNDVLQTFLSNWGGYIGDIMSAKLQRILGRRFYDHVLSLPQRYFDTELSGKIINRMGRGISQISNFMQVMSNNFLQFVFSTIFSLAVVAYYSWPVAILLGSLYPIYIWLTKRTSTKWQAYQRQINAEQDIASGRFAESVSQVRVVKSFLQETRERSFWDRRYGKVLDITRPQSRLWHSQDIVRRLVLNIISLGVFAFIFIETARGTYSIGTMVLLIQYTALIRIPLFTISYLVDQVQHAVSNSREYFAVLDEKPEATEAPNAQPLRVTNGNIEFKNVQFGYDTDKKVIKDVSFRAAPDTKVALVGESGEGKSTLTNLLLGLYTVNGGQILIDGQDIARATRRSLRAAIGVVFQEPALFSGTIRENIAYAKPKATHKEIIAAAKAANAHEFIQKFEKGYDTEIGERGLKLSGGQKQRIAIARALLKDAPILILDEATSSLDSKSEMMVQEALEHLMKGRTTLIIAHRLSTIQSVDQIVVLKNGRVSESGAPAVLAKTQGIYAELLALQQRKTEANTERLKQYDIAS